MRQTAKWIWSDNWPELSLGKVWYWMGLPVVSEEHHTVLALWLFDQPLSMALLASDVAMRLLSIGLYRFVRHEERFRF